MRPESARRHLGGRHDHAGRRLETTTKSEPTHGATTVWSAMESGLASKERGRRERMQRGRSAPRPPLWPTARGPPGRAEYRRAWERGALPRTGQEEAMKTLRIDGRRKARWGEARGPPRIGRGGSWPIPFSRSTALEATKEDEWEKSRSEAHQPAGPAREGHQRPEAAPSPPALEGSADPPQDQIEGGAER